jgi:HAD superfamily hydrolase (TIGR01458 family)
MKAILFDIDGVIYEGERAVPGASEVIGWVRREDIPHLFLTNTSSRPRSAVAAKLAGMGIEIPSEAILTPPAAAADWLRRERPGPAALFVRRATRSDFEGVELLDDEAESGAGAVVVGDMGERWDYPTLNRAFRLLMNEPRPRLLALGMTRYWKAGDGLRLDTAPFVKALEHAAGVQALVLGKPAEGFFRAALDKLGARPGETLMIGDDIRGDIGGARGAGLQSMLVRTGKFRPADLEGDVQPDAVVGSVADLPEWWRTRRS